VTGAVATLAFAPVYHADEERRLVWLQRIAVSSFFSMRQKSIDK